MKIAICGCGIGGLAFAIYACRSGHDVTLYDQFAAPKPVGSGLVIQPVGLEVLDELGAKDYAVKNGAKIYGMIGHEAETKIEALNVSYGTRGSDVFGLGIHRSSLFEALFAVVRKQPIKIEAAHHVMSSQYDHLGRSLTFNDGSTAGPFDLVVDAMGAKSTLSRLNSKSLEFGALWGTLDWPDEADLPYDLLQQKYRRASNMVGVLPIGNFSTQNTKKAAFFWSLEQNSIEAWRKSSIEAWQSEVLALWPEIAPFVKQIRTQDQLTPAIYSHGSLIKPFDDRLVHIGDAAHRASPQLGQGANMALLDAAALIKALDQSSKKAALGRYTRSRALHTMSYQTMSQIFTPFYQSRSRVLPVIRDYLLAPLSKVPPMPFILRKLVTGDLVKPII